MKKELDLQSALKMLNECGTNINDQYESKVLEIINKALTPPTVEDVCELLSKHYNGYDVYFRQATQEFIVESKFAGIEDTVAYKENGKIFIELPLPPNIIKEIAQFYEGLEQ